MGVKDQLKRNFPDWARTTQTEPSTKVPWVGLPFTSSAGCDVEAYDEIKVSGAACDDVEALLLDPGRWPEVYTNAYAIKAPATLTPGARFTWRTFGTGESCTVQSEASSDGGFPLGWTCDATYLVPIPDFGPLPVGRVQDRWNCAEVSGGIVISIQECQVGRAVHWANYDFLQGEMKDMIQRGLEAWVEGLKCKLDDHAWSVRMR